MTFFFPPEDDSRKTKTWEAPDLGKQSFSALHLFFSRPLALTLRTTAGPTPPHLSTFFRYYLTLFPSTFLSGDSFSVLFLQPEILSLTDLIVPGPGDSGELSSFPYRFLLSHFFSLFDSFFPAFFLCFRDGRYFTSATLAFLSCCPIG